ncbi:MAG TPA: BMP family ABC transporter substrate-binding protein [Blastocatellia bacterium]|nr:BMP family ABC transporter substrate-binding protein [Blastocatellia bacterium]
MKKVVLGLLLSVALILAGCSRVFDRIDDAHGQPRVGIVFDIGGKDDKSFNSAAWEGVKMAAQRFAIHVRDVEPGEPSSIEPSMRILAERGYDLIIGVGFAQAPIMANVARDYPNIKFAIVDGLVDSPNVASLLFKEHEGSFLVGMIAGLTTKTNKVGFVGGMDIPLIHRFQTGYEEGVRYANPKAQVYHAYIGITDGAWNNPGKGKELARAQIESGADVIFQAAGNSGLGVFDAAAENKVLAIGVDSNQNWVKPGFILTSMMKRVDNAVFTMIEDLVNNRFTGGLHLFGLENNGVGYALDDYNRSLIKPEVLKEVEEAKNKIINHEITVTDAMAKPE